MFLSLGLFENKNFFCENESGLKNTQIATHIIEPDIELVESDFDFKRKVALKSQSKHFNLVEEEHNDGTSDETNDQEKANKRLFSLDYNKKSLIFSNGLLATHAILLVISHSITFFHEFPSSEMIHLIFLLVLLSIGPVFHIFTIKILWKIKTDKLLRWKSVSKAMLGFNLAHFLLLFLLTGFKIYLSFNQSEKNANGPIKKEVPNHITLCTYLHAYFFNLLIYVSSFVSDIKFLKGLNTPKIYTNVIE